LAAPSFLLLVLSLGGGRAEAAPPVQSVVPAVVYGFSPTSGRAGSQVTVTGLGFAASDRVFVDGRPARAPSVTATRIGFTLPAGVSRGAITLRRAGAKEVAVGVFAVLPDAKVTALEPGTGPVGTLVSIRGSGFLPGDAVTFHGQPLTPVSRARDLIVVVVPKGAESDFVAVGPARSRQKFVVVLPPPSIGSFVPGLGPPGTKVTIHGESFGRDDHAYLGTTRLELGARTDDSLEVTIPRGAKKSDQLTVKGPRGASTSTQVFRVVLPPVLQKFAPTAGAPGARVEIFGAHFLPGDQVKQGGTGLRMVDYDEERLVVELDRDAESGAFEVFRDSQKLATSARPFEVLRTPTVTGFQPTTGLAGTHVTLTGTHFTPETVVRYGKRPLRIVKRSGTVALEVEVPRGDVAEAFTVETHGGSAVTPTAFEVFRYSTVARLAPVSGRQGTRVTVSGAGFGPTDRFFLGDVELPVVERRADACVVTVVSAASSGTLSWESHGKRQVSRLAFAVVRPPTLMSFAPLLGPAGSQVVLTGLDFNDRIGCRFGQQPCKVVRRKLPTELVVEIPRTAAGTDFLWIEHEGKRFKAAAPFQVVLPPTVASFSPVAGAAGTEVTITGANFTATSEVRLGDTPAPVTSRQLPGVLVVTVPTLPIGTYALSVSDGTFKVRAPQRFKVAVVPRVTSIAPLTGTSGTEVTVVGENFGARALVWFGDVACTIVRREGKTKLVVTIPAGTSGKEYFTVAEGGKRATSQQVFEVR
jgi:hypothetical protein